MVCSRIRLLEIFVTRSGRTSCSTSRTIQVRMFGLVDPYLRRSHTVHPSVKKGLGKRLVPLYFDWREAFFERYNRQLATIRSEGLRGGELVSDGEDLCTAPRFAPNGEKVIWSCYSRATGASLWLANGEGKEPERLLQDRGAEKLLRGEMTPKPLLSQRRMSSTDSTPGPTSTCTTLSPRNSIS